VSLTVFNWGTAVGWGKWASFDQLVAPTYAALVRFDKPVMVSEIGTVRRRRRRAAGSTAHDVAPATGYPDVKAVVWFSYRYSRWADFRLARRVDHRAGVSTEVALLAGRRGRRRVEVGVGLGLVHAAQSSPSK
jgi:hypothetical protein